MTRAAQRTLSLLGVFLFAVVLSACGRTRLGPAAEGHRLLDRWPNPTPAWVNREPYAPVRLESEDSLVFVGRAEEAGFYTGKRTALAEADQTLARTISARVLQCAALRGNSRDDAGWNIYTRQVVSAFISGVLPPLEYQEKWRREDGSTYHRWYVRSAIRTRQLRESLERSTDLLEPGVADEVRRAVRMCISDGVLP